MNRRISSPSIVKIVTLGIIAVSLVLSPWEPTLLQGPSSLMRHQHAHAQTPPQTPVSPIVNGTLTQTSCPVDGNTWVARDALCVSEMEACPTSPMTGVSMLVSESEYAELCADPKIPSTNIADYRECRGFSTTIQHRGYIARLTEDTATSIWYCQLLQLKVCGGGFVRIDEDTCRKIVRRTWTCPTDHAPANQFGKCYNLKGTSVGTGQHACGSHAPSFVIGNCEAYVGADYVTTPTSSSALCSTYDTGLSTSLADHTNNAYWCIYDRTEMLVDCHTQPMSQRPAQCSTAVSAFCLKRASDTSGCGATARALRCRPLQAQYADSTVTADEVFAEGCSPCVVLPFDATPSHCLYLTNAPLVITGASSPANRALEFEADFEWDHANCATARAALNPTLTNNCRLTRVCDDPPSGRIEWESTHASGSPVVNSPIIAHLRDAPTNKHTVWAFQVTPEGTWAMSAPFLINEYSLYEYGSASAGDQFVQIWPESDQQYHWNGSQPLNALFGTGPCMITDDPQFRLEIEELWFDVDSTTISDLFSGNDVLTWNAMSSSEKAAFSTTRGFSYIDSSTTPTARATEIARRQASNQTISCNRALPTWCRWVPTGVGYFRMRVVGGWHLTRFETAPQWYQKYTQLSNLLTTDMVSTVPGSCSSAPNSRARSLDTDCVLTDIRNKLGITPAEAGFTADAKNLTARPACIGPTGVCHENDRLYLDSGASSTHSDAGSVLYRCPPRDIRVDCGSAGGQKISVSYTETDWIGIKVHGIQVLPR